MELVPSKFCITIVSLPKIPVEYALIPYLPNAPLIALAASSCSAKTKSLFTSWIADLKSSSN